MSHSASEEVISAAKEYLCAACRKYWKSNTVAMSVVLQLEERVLEEHWWSLKPRSSGQLYTKGGPKNGSARRPQFWSRAICAELKAGPSGGPIFGAAFCIKLPAGACFNDHQCPSKTRSSSCKTLLMATAGAPSRRKRFCMRFVDPIPGPPWNSIDTARPQADVF